MSNGAATPREMARRLLAHEVRGSNPPDVADAAERVCGKLEGQLVDLIGAKSYRAIVHRALRTAQTRFSFLRGIEVGGEGEECLKGLEQNVQGQDPDSMYQALETIVAGTLALLIDLIGEELALRRMRRGWPELWSG